MLPSQRRAQRQSLGIPAQLAASPGVVNVDAIVIMQEPRIAPYRSAMREALSAALATEVTRVTVRASTTDRLGFAGRGEGAACQAVALLRRP